MTDPHHIDPHIDQVKLTAYALNDLPPEDAAEVELWLSGDAAARRYVETVREEASVLRRAYAARTDNLTDEQHEALTDAIGDRPPRSPLPYLVAGLGIAAAAAVAFVLILPIIREQPAPPEDPAPAQASVPQQPTRDTLPPTQPPSQPEPPVAPAAPQTAATGYDAVRDQILRDRSLPDPDAVRIEQLVNHFDFPPLRPVEPAGHAGSADEHDNPPVSVSVELGPAPWNANHRLAVVRLQAADPADEGSAAELAVRVDVAATDPTRGYHRIGYESEPTPANERARIMLAPGDSHVILYELAPSAEAHRAAHGDDPDHDTLDHEEAIASLRELMQSVPPDRRPALEARIIEHREHLADQHATESLQADESAQPAELLTLRLDYTAAGDAGRPAPTGTLEFPIRDTQAAPADTSADFKFAAAVAGFGLLLTDSPQSGDAGFDLVTELAELGQGEPPQGPRARFLDLVRAAAALAEPPPPTNQPQGAPPAR